MAERATRSLVKELLRSYRFTLVTLTATLVLSLLSSGYLLLVAQPRVEDYVKMGFQARMLQVGMLEQETGLRGYLASGDEEFLEPYASGRVRSEGAEAALLEILNDEGADGLATAILSVLVPRAKWVEWAQKAAVRDPSPGQGLTEFLRKGRDLFNIYQVADDASTALIVSRRQQAVDNQRVALVAVLLGYLLLLVGAAGLAIRRRRELHASMVAPTERMPRNTRYLHEHGTTGRE
ncbi:MAG: CHASE3 domain-containing protein, partial [Nocardioides sp.]